MTLQSNCNTKPWRRATGMWVGVGPSGEPVLAGGEYLLLSNESAGAPGQPPYVLYQRRAAPSARSGQLRLPF